MQNINLGSPRGEKRKSQDTDHKKSRTKKKNVKRAETATDMRIELDEEDDRKRIASLLETFTHEQMERYESFRRSHFDKYKVKAVMKKTSDPKVNDQVAVAMGGVAKVFAGELIELARQDMNDFKGSIHPFHIRNAFRKMKQMGKLPYLNNATTNTLR